MNDNNPGSRDQNQRVCTRINLTRKILFELDNGDILEGQSVDISPRGVLMETQRQPGSDLSGSAGTLFVISDEGQFSIGYPCRVVRLKGHSIALEIHKKAAAAFGLYMTKELLRR
jgi:hypothetical protein